MGLLLLLRMRLEDSAGSCTISVSVFGKSTLEIEDTSSSVFEPVTLLFFLRIPKFKFKFSTGLQLVIFFSTGETTVDGSLFGNSETSAIFDMFDRLLTGLVEMMLKAEMDVVLILLVMIASEGFGGEVSDSIIIWFDCCCIVVSRSFGD